MTCKTCGKVIYNSEQIAVDKKYHGFWFMLCLPCAAKAETDLKLQLAQQIADRLAENQKEDLSDAPK